MEIIRNPDVELLIQKLNLIYENDRLDETPQIGKAGREAIKNLISDETISHGITHLTDSDYMKKINFDTFSEIYTSIESLYEGLTEIREQIDMDIFFKEGFKIDISELKKKYKERDLEKIAPVLDFKRIEELYTNPPERIYTYYDKRRYILVDKFTFRKYMIGIIQMIFDHMDLLVCSVGPEGTGKSLQISQDMLVCYYIMKEISLITYEFRINDIWFNTLHRFREAEDRFFSDPFRILGLDEGNELNRQDWKDDEVKLFFQRLRRERYNRRLKFISLPVLGEMIPNIVLSRMNFITDMKSYNEPKSGTLKKGDYNYYIIPRGYHIYSPFLKKNLERNFIKTKLFDNIKDKKYLKGMPEDIIIKKCNNNGVWGFNQEQYNKYLKESNKSYTVSKGVTMSPMESFMLYKAHITPKKIGIKTNDVRWASLQKILSRNSKRWENDPEMLERYEAYFKKRVEQLQEKFPDPED